MKHLVLGLIGLALTLPRVGLMCIAWAIVTVTMQLERLQDWVDFHAGQPGFDPDDDDFPSGGVA